MATNLVSPFASCITQWAGRSLPILQQSKDKLQAMLAGIDDVHRSDVTGVVLHDPLLTALVLRAANQRQRDTRNALTNDVISIQGCLALYGLRPFLEQFANTPVVESILLPDRPQVYNALLDTITRVRFAARMAREFAIYRYDARLDEIFIAAILSGLPKLFYLLSDKEVEAPDEESANDMLVAWEFPESVVELQPATFAITPRQQLQADALALAELLNHGWWQPDVMQFLQNIAWTLQLSQDECWDIARNNILHFARQEGNAVARLPAAYALPMEPGDWGVIDDPVEHSPVVPPTAVFGERLAMMQGAIQGGVTVSRLVGLALRVFTDGLLMSRVAFLAHSTADQQLKAKFVQSPNILDRLRDFTLPLDLAQPAEDDGHLFAQMLRKPQAIWLNEATLSSLQKQLPGAWLQRFGTGDFCAMSVFMGNRPIGIFVGQRPDNMMLTETSFLHFKQVCQLVSDTLTKLAPRS